MTCTIVSSPLLNFAMLHLRMKDIIQNTATRSVANGGAAVDCSSPRFERRAGKQGLTWSSEGCISINNKSITFNTMRTAFCCV